VSDVGCSLNGECVGGVCKCDPSWAESSCEKMRFMPAKSFPAYGTNPSIVTWGGGIIFDGKRHHLFASRMTNNCNLGHWPTNSRVDHAISTAGPEGPYEFSDVAIPTWSHNPVPLTLKDGRFAIIHIGMGNGSVNGGANCSSHSAFESPIQKEGSALTDHDHSLGSTIHVSDSLYGPWVPIPNDLGDCNNPAPWVHKNGTIFVGCKGVFKRAEDISGPYQVIGTFPMSGSGGIKGSYEDPQIYMDKRGNFHCLYHVLRADDVSTNCTDATVSAHAFSVDGFNWNVSKIQPYGTQIQLETGTKIVVATRERPKPFFDANGVMTHLVNGVTAVPNCAHAPGHKCAACKYNNFDYTVVLSLHV